MSKPTVLSLLINTWMFHATLGQVMYSTEEAIDRAWDAGWRPTLEEAKKLDEIKLGEIFPHNPTPVIQPSMQVEETPEEKRKRKAREYMAKARAAKKAKK